MIKLEDVSFSYNNFEVLSNISLEVSDGEFVAVLGKNGAGKSTFLKLLNALLLPYSGNIYINGRNTKDQKSTYAIRSEACLVLQNPDNQIIHSIVEEDVAFGPENLGLLKEEIQSRISKALKLVKMEEYAKSAVSELSGGQKQKIAVAGVLAMNPKCLLLDEITTMLDAESKRDILNIIKDINEKSRTTVIMVTHDEEEIVLANRVLVFGKGKILLDSSTKNIFYNDELTNRLHIKKPKIIEFVQKLKDKDINIKEQIILENECFEFLEKKLKFKQKMK